MKFEFKVQRVISFSNSGPAPAQPETKGKNKKATKGAAPTPPATTRTRLVCRGDAGVLNILSDAPEAANYKEGQTVTVTVE